MSFDAIHQELSRYRYCTVFVVEGEQLDPDALERELEPLGDSLMVVGDESALKVHVHTDDPAPPSRSAPPGSRSRRSRSRTCTARPSERETRLLELVPDPRDARWSRSSPARATPGSSAASGSRASSRAASR